jgi:hypothetical protein
VRGSTTLLFHLDDKDEHWWLCGMIRYHPAAAQGPEQIDNYASLQNPSPLVTASMVVYSTHPTSTAHTALWRNPEYLRLCLVHLTGIAHRKSVLFVDFLDTLEQKHYNISS